MTRLGSRRTYRAWLVPYTEGTLDTARTAALEARLAHDPLLAAEAEALRAVTIRLRQSAQQQTADTDPRLSLAPVPLWPGVKERLTPPRRFGPQRLLWAGSVCAVMLVLAAWLLRDWGSSPRQMPLPMPATVHTAVNLPVLSAEPPRRVWRTPRRVRGYAQTAKRRPQAMPSTTFQPRRLLARDETSLPADSTPLPSAAILPDAVPKARPAVQISGTGARFRLASPLRDAPRPAEEARPAPLDTPGASSPSPAGPTKAPVTAQDEVPDALAAVPVITAENKAAARAALRHTRRRHKRRRHGHRRMPASEAPAAAPAAAPTPHASPVASHNPAST